MSILIKGMEMPQGDEMLCINITPDGKVCINLDLKCKRIATAVHVPPHGRLIDADNLLIDKSISIIGKGMMFGGQYVFSESEIVNAPTIIEAEEGE